MKVELHICKCSYSLFRNATKIHIGNVLSKIKNIGSFKMSRYELHYSYYFILDEFNLGGLRSSLLSLSFDCYLSVRESIGLLR